VVDAPVKAAGLAQAGVWRMTTQKCVGAAQKCVAA
jgi:hypothetical protein